MTPLQGLAPIADAGTRLVVLGSFPGVASLQAQQYYGHPRNQFWPLLTAMLGCDFTRLAYDERLRRLAAAGVGLWDVLGACERRGSLDANIRAGVPNDLGRLRQLAPGLRVVAHNGGLSARAAARSAALGVAVFTLPSSSPANASWSFERKLAAWRPAFDAAGLTEPHPSTPVV